MGLKFRLLGMSWPCLSVMRHRRINKRCDYKCAYCITFTKNELETGSAVGDVSAWTHTAIIVKIQCCVSSNLGHTSQQKEVLYSVEVLEKV